MFKLVKFVIFSFLFISFNYFSFSNFEKVHDIYLRYTNVYKSYDNAIYFSYKNNLYSLKNNIFKKVFFSKLGIGGVVGGKGLVVVFNSSEICVIDSFTNKLLWNKKIKGTIMSDPVIGDNFLYLDKSSSIVLAFDLYTGQLKWKFDFLIKNYLTYHGSKILLSKDYLIYIVADVKIIVLCKSNGKKVKSFNILSDGFSFDPDFKINKILLYNNIIYIYYTNFDFIVFDINNGNLCYKLENVFILDFFVYKNKLIFINKNFELKIFDKFVFEELYSEKISFFDKSLFCKFLYGRGLLVLYSNENEILFFDMDKMVRSFYLKTNYQIVDLQFDNYENLAYIFSTDFNVFVFKFI